MTGPLTIEQRGDRSLLVFGRQLVVAEVMAAEYASTLLASPGLASTAEVVARELERLAVGFDCTADELRWCARALRDALPSKAGQ